VTDLRFVQKPPVLPGDVPLVGDQGHLGGLYPELFALPTDRLKRRGEGRDVVQVPAEELREKRHPAVARDQQPQLELPEVVPLLLILAA